MMHEIFLSQCIRKLKQYQGRINECVDRLTEEQIWWRGADAGNAIGNLMLHLVGNLRQWILHGVSGWPDTRIRDLEFDTRGGETAADLKTRLDEVVKQAVGAIESLTEERLLETITVQNYQVTVLEAVSHVTQHFAEHTGQIVYATKLLTGQGFDWYAHLNRKPHGHTTP
jgi:uncharacterized damage-inducible protein DinB